MPRGFQVEPGRVGFGFSVFPYSRFRDTDELAAVVQEGEELGFDAVLLPEHLLPPAWPNADPASKLWYDPLTLAAFLAGKTSRIAFLTSVLVVPYYHPIRLAKALATLDVVSKGRIWLGVGAGWMPAEFKRLGISLADRSAITDEYLRAMVELWTNDAPEFEGQYVSFRDVSFLPRPVQQPHIPILVGGTGPRPFRRVVELGQGWYPMTGGLDEVRRGVTRLRALFAAAGRDPASLWVGCGGISMGTDDLTGRMRHDAGGSEEAAPPCANPNEAIRRIYDYRDAGATFLSIGFRWQSASELAEQLRQFARDVIPAVRPIG